ncbi:MAG TPA: DUF4190 domain-containing protein [Bellilinea sp.]|nr:DUF4190 domain-containing protein [Bellilinea sp.]
MDNRITTVRTTRTNSLAIVSLVSSLAGLSVFPWLGSIIGIITGNIAGREIVASTGAEDGEGMAKAGLILGRIGALLPLVLLLIIVALGLFFMPIGMFNW